jgi:hypothetical protein
MDGKGFFLGLIAAVVLFLLWKKESRSDFNGMSLGPTFQPQQPTSVGPCGNGGGCGPSAAAAPGYQSNLAQGPGTDGLISPGTPPLQGSAGTGSWYGPDGPSPDNSFTNFARTAASPVSTTIPVNFSSTPGSPTTPANQVPVRAVMPTGSYAQIGFQQRYNIAGVPRVYATRMSAA